MLVSYTLEAYFIPIFTSTLHAHTGQRGTAAWLGTARGTSEAAEAATSQRIPHWRAVICSSRTTDVHRKVRPCCAGVRNVLDVICAVRALVRDMVNLLFQHNGGKRHLHWSQTHAYVMQEHSKRMAVVVWPFLDA